MLGFLATAVWLGASMVGVPSVGAQAEVDFDHLGCAEVTKDSNPKEEQLVDLENKLGLEPGCALVTKAAYICAPTVKFRLDEIDPSGDDPRGEGYSHNMLCYKVSCDKREKQLITLDDQFGQREIQIKEAKLLCTPGEEPK
jgi:hypothetical protein